MARYSLFLSLLIASLVSSATLAEPTGASLRRVVIVMRHGVRPPTKAKPIPDGYTTQVWPAWPVPPGYLTPHGAQAVVKLAAFDAKRYGSILPHSCPDARQVRVVADTDERTVATARAYVDTLFVGCKSLIETAGAGETDPRFSPFEVTPTLDAEVALKSAQSSLPSGGTAAFDEHYQAELALLDHVLDCAASACSLAHRPTQLEAPNGRVKIAGGLAVGASLAQTLLLEYADGKPMTEVGWGKVTREDITRLSALHALEFALTARPKAIADYGSRALLREIDQGLFAASGVPFTLLVGHDANLAYLGGALGLHWHAPGFAADDPSPGGALIFELWRAADGHKYVMVRYRSQSLDEIRSVAQPNEADSQKLAFPGCGNGDTCSETAFKHVIESIISH